MALTTVSAGKRHLFVQEWLACTLRTYPDHTGRFLREERDPFRNPVGCTLRTALGQLTEELFGDFDRTRVTASLEAVVRLRAVQDFSPAEALGFIPLSRSIARTVSGDGGSEIDAAALTVLDARIDELALIAFDLYERCRNEIRQIAARAARRRVYVLERAQRLTPDVEIDCAGVHRSGLP
jgi:hypothetical protein